MSRDSGPEQTTVAAGPCSVGSRPSSSGRGIPGVEEPGWLWWIDPPEMLPGGVAFSTRRNRSPTWQLRSVDCKYGRLRPEKPLSRDPEHVDSGDQRGISPQFPPG